MDIGLCKQQHFLNIYLHRLNILFKFSVLLLEISWIRRCGGRESEGIWNKDWEFGVDCPNVWIEG